VLLQLCLILFKIIGNNFSRKHGFSSTGSTVLRIQLRRIIR
jgi:hypothetical protein